MRSTCGENRVGQILETPANHVDSITFGKAEPLPAAVGDVALGYTHEQAALHAGLLDFHDAQHSWEKLKSARKKVENAVLRFRKKMAESKAAARKPDDHGPEPELWPAWTWSARTGHRSLWVQSGHRKAGVKP